MEKLNLEEVRRVIFEEGKAVYPAAEVLGVSGQYLKKFLAEHGIEVPRSNSVFTREFSRDSVLDYIYVDKMSPNQLILFLKTDRKTFFKRCPLTQEDLAQLECNKKALFKAGQERAKETVRRKYGVNSVAELEQSRRARKDAEVRRKISETLRNKTEEERKITNNKKMQTWLRKYGVSHAAQYTGTKNKQLETNLKKYGAVNAQRALGENISKLEKEVCDFIKEIAGEYKVHTSDYTVLGNSEIDIYIPELKVGVEVNGDYWHSVQMIKDVMYHQNKTLRCRENGIRLIHIWEYEWKDSRIRERVKSQLRGLFGQSRKVFARNTTVRLLSTAESREFFDLNSEFKYKPCKFTVGLCDGDGAILMAYGVGNLQTGRGGLDSTQFEIARSATVLNTVVVGGSSKLMKAVKDYLQGAPVHYFVDLDKHTGSSLEAMGATLINVGPPSLRIMFRRPVTLRNSRGECKSFEAERLYSRQPKFHAAVKEQEAEDNLITLANAGTLHYVI